MASTLRAILHGEGYRVENCADGAEALQYLKSGETAKPDLVLMDVMMPRVSGLEVLHAIRAEPDLADMPVVLMSVIVPAVDHSEYRWQAFLRKPFTLQALVKTVRQHARPGIGVVD